MTVTAREFSFTRARRLDGPLAYAAVFAFRCSVNGRLFRVYARPNGLPSARLGVVVSKRTIPAAVARNYCRRLVREVFRVELADLAGLDLIVRPQAIVTRSHSAVARAEILDLLRRARGQCRTRSAVLHRHDS